MCRVVPYSQKRLLFQLLLCIGVRVSPGDILRKINGVCDHHVTLVIAYYELMGTEIGFIRYTKINAHIQGGPAKVRPTYFFDGNILMHR